MLRYVNSTRAPQRAHEVLQELRDISSMAMEYFDEKIVPILKRKLPGSDVSGRLMGSPPGISYLYVQFILTFIHSFITCFFPHLTIYPELFYVCKYVSATSFLTTNWVIVLSIFVSSFQYLNYALNNNLVAKSLYIFITTDLKYIY